MNWEDNSSRISTDPVVELGVRELLQKRQEADSHCQGKIVDLATFSSDKLYENFGINTDRLTNESRRLLQRLADAGTHQESIALCVELPSDDIFVDIFTYSSSGNDELPSIESLAMTLQVDISSVHHLVGKSVDVARKDNRWVIWEHSEKSVAEPTVTGQNFLNPIMIGGLLTPLGGAIGWQTGVSLPLALVTGVSLSILVTMFLLYITLAAKRDHPLPSVLGYLYTPDYTDGHGNLTDDDPVRDVEHGEFKRLVTLVPEDEEENERAVLHNIGVVVLIPPLGERTIPLRSPAGSWRGTTIKKLVYYLAPSVDTIDRAEGKLVPLKCDNNQIRIDRSRLDVKEREINRTFTEKLADAYVLKLNSLFGVGSRDDIYFQ